VRQRARTRWPDSALRMESVVTTIEVISWNFSSHHAPVQPGGDLAESCPAGCAVEFHRGGTIKWKPLAALAQSARCPAINFKHQVESRSRASRAISWRPYRCRPKTHAYSRKGPPAPCGRILPRKQIIHFPATRGRAPRGARNRNIVFAAEQLRTRVDFPTRRPEMTKR